jgi:hypothetical protein
MVLLLEQRRVLSIVNEKEVLSASTAAGTSEAAMDKAAQFWQRHGVARSTILLEMTPGVRSKYSSIQDVVQLWKKLKEDYTQKVQRDIWSLRSELNAVRLAEEGTVDAFSFKIQRIVDDYNLVSKTKMDPGEHAYYLLQGIPNNDEWKLFKQLIRPQHLKSTASTSTGGVGASGSTDSEEVGLERDPARLVTMMLDEEANILKDRGVDKNMVLYSGAGGKKPKNPKGAANSKNFRSTTVPEVDKDIECYGCHKKGHKRSECPNKEKRSKSNSDIECYECHEKGRKRPECPEGKGRLRQLVWPGIPATFC